MLVKLTPGRNVRLVSENPATIGFKLNKSSGIVMLKQDICYKPVLRLKPYSQSKLFDSWWESSLGWIWLVFT